MSALSGTLQRFFTTYLVGQRGASAHTELAYRDTWRMLLVYVHAQTGTCPADIEIADLDTEAVTGFLQHLETVRVSRAIASEPVTPGSRRSTRSSPSTTVAFIVILSVCLRW